MAPPRLGRIEGEEEADVTGTVLELPTAMGRNSAL